MRLARDTSNHSVKSTPRASAHITPRHVLLPIDPPFSQRSSCTHVGRAKTLIPPFTPVIGLDPTGLASMYEEIGYPARATVRPPMVIGAGRTHLLLD